MVIDDFLTLVPYPAMVFIALAVFVSLFGVVSLSLSKLLRMDFPSLSKNDSYECGVAPLGPIPDGFVLKYAVVAIMFLLFDIELIFLFPWAAYYRKLGYAALYEMTFFLLVLVIAYVVIWKKGVFEWK